MDYQDQNPDIKKDKKETPKESKVSEDIETTSEEVSPDQDASEKSAPSSGEESDRQNREGAYDKPSDTEDSRAGHKENARDEEAIKAEEEIDEGQTLEEPHEYSDKGNTLNEPGVRDQLQETARASLQKMSEQFSSVAAQPTHKKIAIAAMIIFGVLAIYFLLGMDSQTKEEKAEERKREVQAQREQLAKKAEPVTPPQNEPTTSRPAPQARQLPELPPLTEPTPPAPPPPPAPAEPGVPSLPEGRTKEESVKEVVREPVIRTNTNSNREEVDRRRKAQIMVFGSGGIMSGKSQSDGSGGGGSGQQAKINPSKKNVGSFLGFGEGSFDSSGIAKSSASQVKATNMGDLSRLIAQGKILHAVLETAINTDLPGSLRAVITRDIYAESGKRILIPKGSRIVGTYSADVSNGQTRVAIVWNRVMRPDGIDIAVDSIGVDRLGRSGVPGHLDNKLWPRLTNAFLVSFVIPVITRKLSGVKKGSQVSSNTTTGTDGNITNTVTGDVQALQWQQSTEEFNKIAKEVIEQSFSTKPTITINQGEPINIFVQKDLVFPDQAELNRLKAQR